MVRLRKKKAGSWFIDEDSSSRLIWHRIKKRVLTARTAFQRVDIFDTDDYGRMVVLDEKIQSAEADEFIYHEALVHPAMIAHSDPRTVLLLGGGEGATLREVLKHPMVESVTMIDIDREFVKICRKRLGTWHKGAFKDPRVELIYDNALRYVKNVRKKYDIIISDISDPDEKGPAASAYSKEYYSLLSRRLKPGGKFATHATEVSCISEKNVSAKIYKLLSGIFRAVSVYFEYIPSYGALWAFAFCSMRPEHHMVTPEQVNVRLKKRSINNLSYYDAGAHARLFSLPKCLRKFLDVD
jgi:spermidine synthase